MAATITLTYPFSAEDTELLNKLLGNSGGATAGATSVAPTGGRADVGAAITPAEEYFPADASIAKFLSPENSQILDQMFA